MLIIPFFATRRCDADPVALAKYVLALVKKEKPIPQLQASMENSLDVFLQKGSYAYKLIVLIPDDIL